jgi:hypothetical protein
MTSDLTTGRLLLSVTEELVPPLESEYLDRGVRVDDGVRSLRVELDFTKVTDRFQLYAALIDPHGVLRGHVQCPGGPGPRALRFEIGRQSASPGCIAGPIPAGDWTLRVDLDRFREAGRYTLRVVADAEVTAPSLVSPDRSVTTASAATTSGAVDGWVRGELHVHTVHSDGRDTVEAILAEARARALDFVALSDHFTWSHWSRLTSSDPGLIALPSIEVTTHRGHGNAHGITRWVDVYVDRDGRDCADLVRDVHAQHGLFGVNHPFSGQQAWRRADVDWADVDLLEVVNQGQDANNDAAIGLWDRLLCQGYDIAAVAGTDCHDLNDPAQELGQVVTAVKVAERSAAGLLDGLRRGATVVTRGAALDLRLRSGGRRAGLGEHLVLDGPVEIEVEYDTAVPCSIYVLRDGLMWLQDDVDAGAGTYTVVDEHPVAGPYRVELHRRSSDPRHWASAWRSHESFEALTSSVRTIPSTSDHRPEGEP